MASDASWAEQAGICGYPRSVNFVWWLVPFNHFMNSWAPWISTPLISPEVEMQGDRFFLPIHPSPPDFHLTLSSFRWTKTPHIAACLDLKQHHPNEFFLPHALFRESLSFCCLSSFDVEGGWAEKGEAESDSCWAGNRRITTK